MILTNIQSLINSQHNNWDTSGDLRRSPSKKTVRTIRHYVLSRSTFLPAILSIRSCWILYKGVVLGWAFIPYCSLPELEACMEVWGFMEMIHSRSYTHIIKNVYADPSDVFDHILTDDRIVERAMSVTQAYNDFINAAHQWDNSNDWKHALEEVPYAQESRYELKRKLFRAVANVNILEGIRFLRIICLQFCIW